MACLRPCIDPDPGLLLSSLGNSVNEICYVAYTIHCSCVWRYYWRGYALMYSSGHLVSKGSSRCASVRVETTPCSIVQRVGGICR